MHTWAIRINMFVEQHWHSIQMKNKWKYKYTGFHVETVLNKAIRRRNNGSSSYVSPQYIIVSPFPFSHWNCPLFLSIPLCVSVSVYLSIPFSTTLAHSLIPRWKKNPLISFLLTVNATYSSPFFPQSSYLHAFYGSQTVAFVVVIVFVIIIVIISVHWRSVFHFYSKLLLLDWLIFGLLLCVASLKLFNCHNGRMCVELPTENYPSNVRASTEWMKHIQTLMSRKMRDRELESER